MNYSNKNNSSKKDKNFSRSSLSPVHSILHLPLFTVWGKRAGDKNSPRSLLPGSAHGIKNGPRPQHTGTKATHLRGTTRLAPRNPRAAPLKWDCNVSRHAGVPHAGAQGRPVKRLHPEGFQPAALFSAGECGFRFFPSSPF